MTIDPHATLKIATWNLDRPKKSTQAKNARISRVLREIDADIWVLTETNSCITPGIGYVNFSTPPLLGSSFEKGEKYEGGENRVTIWVRNTLEAESLPGNSHSHSSICVGIRTLLGAINVYGTVIGIYGRGEDFKAQLAVQIQDWESLSDLCIAGDFNTSFADNFYHSKEGRQAIVESFSRLKIESLTSQVCQNIDHIAFAESLLNGTARINHEWNRCRDKRFSDHMGVGVTLISS